MCENQSGGIYIYVEKSTKECSESIDHRNNVMERIAHLSDFTETQSHKKDWMKEIASHLLPGGKGRLLFLIKQAKWESKVTNIDVMYYIKCHMSLYIWHLA